MNVLPCGEQVSIKEGNLSLSRGSSIGSLWTKIKTLFSIGGSTNHVVGVDFGPESIKLLKISAVNHHYCVEHFAIKSIPANLIVKNEIKDPATISNLLRDMFKEADIISKEIALAIPRSSTIIKNLTIDSRLNRDEIESRAWIEANRLFPDLIGNIYLDFAILESEQNKNQSEMVLVVCRKDQVNPYLEMVQGAGLNVKIVDVNCYALERALPLTVNITPDHIIGLLNLNTSLSTFIVLHNKHLIHAHDQSFDGKRLMSQVQTYLKSKEELGPEDAGLYNILRENLVSHLRHTIHFFYSSRPNVRIQAIVLSGDCASIPNLSNFIERELGIKTQLANPFSNMTFAKAINTEKISEFGPALMLCCGLALASDRGNQL